MASGKFIAYYRVSTERQGRSGLGLEAQRQAVANYLNGGRWTLLREFTEVESGKKNDRDELAAAMAACRLYRATLVIAKLDRLSRSAAFLMRLQDEGVDFVAVDMPTANPTTVGFLAVVAQHERDMISSRTRAALAAAKARGVQMGNPNGLSRAAAARGSEMGNAAKAKKAAARLADIAPEIRAIQSAGITGLSAIAATLNERGVSAARGGEWTATQVGRVLARLG